MAKSKILAYEPLVFSAGFSHSEKGRIATRIGVFDIRVGQMIRGNGNAHRVRYPASESEWCSELRVSAQIDPVTSRIIKTSDQIGSTNHFSPALQRKEKPALT